MHCNFHMNLGVKFLYKIDLCILRWDLRNFHLLSHPVLVVMIIILKLILNLTIKCSIRRLKKMQPQQPGYNSSRVYLELLADLPWQTTSEEVELDLKAAKERLDSDHYGLVKIKQRIIEYLAVRKVDQLST